MRAILNTLPLAYLPLFICLPSMSVPALHFLGGNIVRDSINLCASVIVCGIGAYACFVARVDRWMSRHIALIICWLTLSLAAGLLATPSYTNVLFYAQTVLPLFAIWYGYVLIRTHRDVSYFIRISVNTTNVVVLCLYAIALGKYGMMFITDRMQIMYELEYGIPQFKSYYPVCVQFTFSLAFAGYLFGERRYRSSMLYSLLIHVSFLMLCWSRAGLLGFALTAGIQTIFAFARGKRAEREKTVVAVIALLLVLGGLSLKFGTTVASRQDVQEFGNSSDEKRVNFLLDGLDRCLDRPLFGDSFVPAWDEREGGLVDNVDRLFGSHNQYVDLMLRGGVLYLLLFLLLLYKAIRCGFALTKVQQHPGASEYVVLGVASTAFLLAILVQSNFQLYFIQLLTAVPCMMLMGVLYRVRHLIPQTVARRSPAMYAMNVNLLRAPVARADGRSPHRLTNAASAVARFPQLKNAAGNLRKPMR